MTTIHGLPPGDWQVSDRARVAPLTSEDLSWQARLTLRVIRRRTRSAVDFTVFRTFARLGTLFPIHSLLVGRLLASGALSSAEKERVVLRVAWRTGCVYEWAHHAHMAAELGIPEAEVERLAVTDLTGWPDRLAVMLRVADELVAEQIVSDATWQRAQSELGDDAALELCFLVGHYVMVAMTINSTGIQVEDSFLSEIGAHRG